MSIRGGIGGPMRRLGLVGVGLIVAGWLGVVGVQGLGDPLGWAERVALATVALLTAASHLLAGLAAGVAAGRRASVGVPGWVAIQAERHRSLATRPAAWGLGASALAGLMAWSGSWGWLPPAWGLQLAAGVNLGLQPGLLLAEGWAIMAQGRLGRAPS